MFVVVKEVVVVEDDVVAERQGRLSFCSRQSRSVALREECREVKSCNSNSSVLSRAQYMRRSREMQVPPELTTSEKTVVVVVVVGVEVVGEV